MQLESTGHKSGIFRPEEGWEVMPNMISHYHKNKGRGKKLFKRKSSQDWKRNDPVSTYNYTTRKGGKRTGRYKNYVMFVVWMDGTRRVLSN